MVDVEVVGSLPLTRAPRLEQIERLCTLAASVAGVEDAHMAIEFVDAESIARLNAAHRGKPEPTDVLSFPLDGAEELSAGGVGRHRDTGAGAHDRGSYEHDRPPYELGDVIICPEYTADVREAIVHGVLHLIGMDHESDDGEMLAVQAELLSWDAWDAMVDQGCTGLPDRSHGSSRGSGYGSGHGSGS